jgi:hypothetical protein
VIVDDISKVQSLAGVFLNQSATFENNTYIIPDTVDVSTENLFAIGNSAISANSANATLAEWNALNATVNGSGVVSVTGDKIIQLPIAEIQAMIEGYKPNVVNTANTVVDSGVSQEYLNSTNLPTGRDFGTKRYQADGDIIPNYIHTDFPNR